MTKLMTHRFIARSFAVVVAICAILMGLGSARAQESEESTRPSFEAGPYTFNLGLTAGYRNSDITDFNGNKDDWSKNRFYEAYNLRSGLNVNSFNLFGERKADGSGFFDELYVNAFGINDPFTTASIRMRALNSYDFKFDFRQAKYFLNRDDSIFSGLHKYDMTRDFMDASLDIHAMEGLMVNLKFNSVSRSGDMTTTASPFIEESETAIGSFTGSTARGEFYWINVPKNDKTTEFSAGLTAKLPATTSLSLGAGFRSFSQEFSPSLVNDTSLTYTPGYATNAFSGIRGYFSPASKKNWAPAQTPFESWLINNYTDHRESSGPFLYFQGVSRPIPELTMTADVRYESSTSKPSITYDVSGLARTKTSLVFDSATGAAKNAAAVMSNYDATFDGSASKAEWNNITGALSVAAKLTDELTLTAKGMYSNIHEDVNAAYSGVIKMDTVKGKPTVTANTETSVANSYKIPQQTIEGFVSYNPESPAFGNLGLKAGYRYMDRKPDVVIEDEKDAVLSREVQAGTIYFMLNMHPTRMLRLDARVSQTTNLAKDGGNTVDMPIRTAPDKLLTITGGANLEPMDRMMFGLRYALNNGSSMFDPVSIPWTAAARAVNLPSLQYTNNSSSFTANFGYTFREMKLGFNVSGQYKKNDYSIPTTWTRGQIVPTGTPGYIDSMTVMISQNTIDRFVDFTLTWQPMDALHIDGGVSITRSTGEPTTISQTPAGTAPDLTHFGGPYRMEDYHVSAAYDITPNVGINADFEHVGYKEDQVANFWALNNFAGNLIRGGFALKF